MVGGTGFLGYHVVGELLSRGHEVGTLARRAGAPRHPAVTAHVGDVTTLAETARLVRGYDGVVFAAGADDRTVPPRPAYPYFAARNVAPVEQLLRAAREGGATRAVVLGSYFTALHRSWPESGLADRHPYIRSRVAQAAAASAVDGLPASVLEIPFVFGAAPGIRPLWAPVLPWLRSAAPLLAPRGGTAAVSVDTVARTVAGALEQAHSGPCPVVDENLSWSRLLGRFAAAAGRPRQVRRLPSAVLRAALPAAGLGHALRGREPGLRPADLAELLTRELYLDEETCRRLGGPAGSLDEALRETVRGCEETARRR